MVKGEQVNKVPVYTPHLADLKAGGNEAWAAWVENFTSALMKEATVYVGPDRAPDVVQDTWEKLYVKITAPESSIHGGNLPGLAVRTAQRTAIDLLRRDRLVPVEEDELARRIGSGHGVPLDEHVADNVDGERQLEAAMAHVPEVFRETFRRVVDGDRRNEIEMDTGVKQATVGAQRHKAASRLRAVAGDLFDAPTLATHERAAKTHRRRPRSTRAETTSADIVAEPGDITFDDGPGDTSGVVISLRAEVKDPHKERNISDRGSLDDY